MENKPILGDNWIKVLTPGIQTEREKRESVPLDSHQSQLKNEELFYRVNHR